MDRQARGGNFFAGHNRLKGLIEECDRRGRYLSLRPLRSQYMSEQSLLPQMQEPDATRIAAFIGAKDIHIPMAYGLALI